MAGEVNDRVRLLYLHTEEPRRPGFSASTVPNTSPHNIRSKTHTDAQRPHPAVARSASDASSRTSKSSYSASDNSSRRQSSLSSTNTSISVPPWRLPTLDQQMATHPYNYGYDLPCEFVFVGCQLRFHPTDFEAWISHAASHLGGSFPTTVICTFCDTDEASWSNGDAAMNWRERMLHIGSHLETFASSETIRPDYFVIEHMREHGLISGEDYDHALKGTERPHCAYLYSLDYEPQDMEMRRERALQQPHNMRSEDKQRRKEKKNGKSKETYQTPSSHRPQKSHRAHAERR